MLPNFRLIIYNELRYCQTWRGSSVNDWHKNWTTSKLRASQFECSVFPLHKTKDWYWNTFVLQNLKSEIKTEPKEFVHIDIKNETFSNQDVGGCILRSLLEVSWCSECTLYKAYFFFQGPIGREIRPTARIRPSSAQMCCAMSPVCLSIATHRTCQFWADSDPVNMAKTIESPAKRGVRAVIRFLYSEQATRNDILRYFPTSWEYSAAYCSCNNEAPEVFSMGSVWSPTIVLPDLAPCYFHLFPRMKRS